MVSAASWWVMWSRPRFHRGESLAEPLFRAVNEDAQVVAIDLQLAADVVFRSTLEEQPFDELPIFLRQRGDCRAHLHAFLGLQHSIFRRGFDGLGLVAFVVQLIGAA